MKQSKDHHPDQKDSGEDQVYDGRRAGVEERGGHPLPPQNQRDQDEQNEQEQHQVTYLQEIGVHSFTFFRLKS